MNDDSGLNLKISKKLNELIVSKHSQGDTTKSTTKGTSNKKSDKMEIADDD